MQKLATIMFALLLLASGVAADWVEIAQHPHRPGPPRTTFTGDITTGANKLYANSSLTEHAWHRNGPSRTPNFGVVKRVKLQEKQKDVLSERTNTKSVSREAGGYESVGSVRAPNIKIEPSMGNYEKTYDVGKLRKINDSSVRLHNPSRHFSIVTENIFAARPDLFNTNTKIIEKNSYEEILTTKDTTAKRTQVIPNTKFIASDPDDNIMKELQVDNFRVNTKRPVKENKNKVKYNADAGTGNTIYKPTSKSFLEDQSSTTQNTGYSAKLVENVDHNIGSNKYAEAHRAINLGNVTERYKTQQNINVKSDNYADPKVTARPDLNLNGHTETNTIEVIWKLMKVVTDSISQNTRRSFTSKMRYLERLQNNIILNIAERIERAWPDDVENAAGVRVAPRHGRQRRAARGHVEFPSSESALMTISFLTFAVFLIKLVLQVIHTYKNKTMMVTPAVVAAVGRAAARSFSTAQETNL